MNLFNRLSRFSTALSVTRLMDCYGCRILIIGLLIPSSVYSAQCEYKVVDEWNAGFKAEISIINTSDSAIQDWQLNWSLTSGATFNNGWNASYSCSGGDCSATPPSWNPVINPSASYTFGFIADKAGEPADQNMIVNGDICDATPVSGQVLWQLDGAKSSVQYVSMKKEHIAEIASFEDSDGGSAFSSSIADDGAVIFALDLNDVSTGIELRDSRLLSLLFETDLLPTAYFQAHLDINALSTMQAGDYQIDTLSGELSLHGIRQSVTAEVFISKTSATELTVSTLKPVLIDAKTFDMASGIEALRLVANLSSIGEAVPIYFRLHYVANSDTNTAPVFMPTIPADPDSLQGQFNSASAEAQLNWQDNSDNETQFLVRRKPLDGNWQTVAELNANSTMLDEALPDSGEFDYKVIALNTGVPSLPSNIERVVVTEGNALVRGQQTFQSQCAGCHGDNGEGIGSFPALTTERNIDDLIAYIVEFMPIDNPASCDQQCAEDVATFIETLWVTEIACDPALTPIAYGPRQLKILTRTEYQNSVEDLLGIDFNAAAGLSADSQIGFFTNNTHAAIVASSYSNFLLVAEDIAQWSADRNFAPALNCGAVDQDCANQLIDELAPKIFRRPLTDDEVALYQAIADGNESGGDIRAGMQLALEGLLSAPQFLYRSELGEANPANPELGNDAFELTGYEMATFLAYTFTGSTPDQTLLDAAANGELRTETGIIAHAQRLTAGAKQVMSDFVGSWLGTADLALAAKDPAVWPGFAELVPHMQGEINETFSQIMLQEGEQFASLYDGHFTYLNQTLAQHYGISGVSGNDLQRVDTIERGGILANGAFMSRWGESVESSPILRSVRVRRRMLCQDQPDPPAGTFAAREEKLAELSDLLQDPTTTNRVKYHRLTEDTPCTSCHEQYINPLGFGMEDFDTVGRTRTTDLNGNLIDASGDLYAPLNYSDIGDVENFYGTKDLGALLASLPSAQSCLPKQLFRYIIGIGHQNIDSANPDESPFSDEEKSAYACTVDELTETLMSGSPRQMLERFGSLQAVRYRKAWQRQ